MSEALYPVPAALAADARITATTAADMHAMAASDPDAFWREQAQRLDWITPFTKVNESSFDEADFGISWFADGQLNVSANCIDRHLAGRGEQPAIIWEGDDPSESRIITYAQLHEEVCRFANVLKSQGVQRGDRVTLYLPMIPEAAFAMLACTRIGAVHSIVFAGFSPDSLASRIRDCDSRIVITADEGLRGGKKVALKANVDAAIAHCTSVEKVIVVQRTGANVPMQDGRDLFYGPARDAAATDYAPEAMGAEDPLFILYTSGSTGTPKGVLHSTGGYLLWASMTHEHVFDYRPGEVYWCTADIGWVTGHSYVVYGPLANGATSLMFEGVPNYPDHSRFWQICDKWQVSIFYTAPTALRALMREGDAYVQAASRTSLRILGSVGEPINPEAWEWYHRIVGEGRCPIVDTWWQTETGGILIAPLPGATDLKPGSATKPLFGVHPLLVDAEGKALDGATEGNLCIAKSWPGQMRTVYGDHERFFQTYFTTYPGRYFTGDGARRDEDGYYWITGRVDDVINVSGHRFGTAEIEEAINQANNVVESAVVGFPHEIKGQGICAFVVGTDAIDAAVAEEACDSVIEAIGRVARPDRILVVPGLPKTRSGKIMRRILRKIAEGRSSELGDVSTLLNPEVVPQLVAAFEG